MYNNVRFGNGDTRIVIPQAQLIAETAFGGAEKGKWSGWFDILDYKKYTANTVSEIETGTNQ